MDQGEGEENNPVGETPTTDAEADGGAEGAAVGAAEGEAAPTETPEAVGATEEKDTTEPPEPVGTPEPKPVTPTASAAPSATKPKPADTNADDVCGALSPTPSVELIAPAEFEKIIKDTIDILQFCQKKIDEQKVDNHSFGFMLLRIKESLDAYSNDYMPKLNTFLVNADAVTAEYYRHMCAALPPYGDYLPVVEANPSSSMDIGAGFPVSKDDTLNVVKTTTDNYFAGGMFLKTGRTVYKDINNYQPDRNEIIEKVATPLQSWLQLQNNVNQHLEEIREKTFKVKAYVDFLKFGESKNAPALDLSAISSPNNLTAGGPSP